MDLKPSHLCARWAARFTFALLIVTVLFFPLGDFPSLVIKYWHWKTGSKISWRGLVIKVPETYLALNPNNLIEDGFYLSGFKSVERPYIFFEYDPELYTDQFLEVARASFPDSFNERSCSLTGLNCLEYSSDHSSGKAEDFGVILPEMNIRIYYSSNLKNKIDLSKMISKAP